MAAAQARTLGNPRLHLRRVDSTNERARALAIAGAPHGTLVTAAEQTAGRGRQGRSWTAPPGSALLCSLVLRNPSKLLSLIAGVAVCDTIGKRACVKWPNDIVVELAGGDAQTRSGTTPRLAKLAGILVEGRPQEGWAVLGIGLNVAVRIEQLPAELRERAASLELPSSAIEPIMDRLLKALERRLSEPVATVLDAWRIRDALDGREVSWRPSQPNERDRASDGRSCCGVAKGIDDAGRLLVTLAGGGAFALDAGEVHLGSAG